MQGMESTSTGNVVKGLEERVRKISNLTAAARAITEKAIGAPVFVEAFIVGSIEFWFPNEGTQDEGISIKKVEGWVLHPLDSVYTNLDALREYIGNGVVEIVSIADATDTEGKGIAIPQIDDLVILTRDPQTYLRQEVKFLRETGE